MINIILGATVYVASLISCYDGDTCKVKLVDAHPLVEIVTMRFAGFDTPELRGKCSIEKDLAREARTITRDYMNEIGTVYTTGEKGKYGRLLVTAPDLQEELISKFAAVEYEGGKRISWCQGHHSI